MKKALHCLLQNLWGAFASNAPRFLLPCTFGSTALVPIRSVHTRGSGLSGIFMHVTNCTIEWGYSFDHRCSRSWKILHSPSPLKCRLRPREADFLQMTRWTDLFEEHREARGSRFCCCFVFGPVVENGGSFSG